MLGGYEPADPVDAHGEFARRGGIFDVFPAGEELPIRIEFIGDTVESIRRFDPGTQRSVETLDRFGIVPVREGRFVSGTDPVQSNLFQFLRTRDAQVWISEPTDVENHVKGAWEQIGARPTATRSSERKTLEPLPPPTDLLARRMTSRRSSRHAVVLKSWRSVGRSREPGPAVSICPFNRPRFSTAAFLTGSTTSRRRRRTGDHVVFVAGSHGRAERTVELLKDYDVRAVMASDAGDVIRGAVMVAEGWLSKGFRFVAQASGLPAPP